MAKKRRPLTQQDLNASGAHAGGTEALRIIDNLELEGETVSAAGLHTTSSAKPLTTHWHV